MQVKILPDGLCLYEDFGIDDCRLCIDWHNGFPGKRFACAERAEKQLEICSEEQIKIFFKNSVNPNRGRPRNNNGHKYESRCIIAKK